MGVARRVGDGTLKKLLLLRINKSSKLVDAYTVLNNDLNWQGQPRPAPGDESARTRARPRRASA